MAYQDKFYGKKYDGNLTTVEIAKKVKAEIKILFPKKDGYKISVRSKYFSGGSSITIEIQGTPFIPVSPAMNGKGPRAAIPGNVYEYTEEADALSATLNGILNAYNYDGSDIMTDYFDVNFYGSVVWDWSWIYSMTKDWTPVPYPTTA